MLDRYAHLAKYVVSSRHRRMHRTYVLGVRVEDIRLSELGEDRFGAYLRMLARFLPGQRRSGPLGAISSHIHRS